MSRGVSVLFPKDLLKVKGTLLTPTPPSFQETSVGYKKPLPISQQIFRSADVKRFFSLLPTGELGRERETAGGVVFVGLAVFKVAGDLVGRARSKQRDFCGIPSPAAEEEREGISAVTTLVFEGGDTILLECFRMGCAPLH